MDTSLHSLLMKKKVLVGMSGGVDSSVTGLLLVEQGFEVAGVTLKLFENDNTCEAKNDKTCCGYSHTRDAKLVADKLGFRHYVIDGSDVFREKVIDSFINEYRSGSTPNPCINCNEWVKFPLLLDSADKLGYSFVATGHYACLANGVLSRGKDRAKDQSYFLSVIYKSDPARILFPLGDLSKTEVREHAARAGLITAKKKESQDICFVTDGSYQNFVHHDTSAKPGSLQDISGKVVGTHTGIANYTIGQRKGLGAFGSPRFVVSIDAKNNVVVIGDLSDLESHSVRIKSLHWRKDYVCALGDLVDVQIRYRSLPVKGVISAIEQDSITVTCTSAIRAQAPGQTAVLYQGENVVGGGIICPDDDSKQIP